MKLLKRLFKKKIPKENPVIAKQCTLYSGSIMGISKRLCTMVRIHHEQGDVHVELHTDESTCVLNGKRAKKAVQYSCRLRTSFVLVLSGHDNPEPPSMLRETSFGFTASSKSLRDVASEFEAEIGQYLKDNPDRIIFDERYV